MFERRRLFIFGAVLIMAIVVGVVWYKNRPFDPGVDIKTFTTAKQYEDYWKNLAEVYKKDTYGGKTPEETIQLFIDALKKDDVELAAKYFVPEEQKRKLEELKEGTNKGVVSSMLEFYKLNNLKKEYIDDKEYYFNYLDKNGGPGFLFKIVFNDATKVWKIESL